MYVCICNSVTDREIRAAIERGHDSLGKLKAELGVGNGCGKCASCTRHLLKEVKSDTAWSTLAAPAAG